MSGAELQVWPFGKYSGQPIGKVMEDRNYLEWLLNQPWFAEDYRQIHQLILNHGNEAQDSPEHNGFQIRFLEEPMRLAVARRLGFQELDGELCSKKSVVAQRIAEKLGCEVHETRTPLRVSKVRFEDQGWDVGFDILPASYVAFIEAKHGKDYIELLESWKKPKLAQHNRQLLKAHRGTLDVALYQPSGGRKERVAIELKPDLGDDYPSVLRQIQRYSRDETADRAMQRKARLRLEPLARESRKLLIVRRARFTGVSLEQVKAFFASASVELILEHELDVDELTVPEIEDAVEDFDDDLDGELEAEVEDLFG